MGIEGRQQQEIDPVVGFETATADLKASTEAIDSFLEQGAVGSVSSQERAALDALREKIKNPYDVPTF